MSKTNRSKNPDTSENNLLLREARKIVEALGKMFAPCCEVVLHDLTKPNNAIIAIECPLSGRKVGQPTTEMGLERLRNPAFPDVIQNYANTFPDGRSVKSTSIGLRNSKNEFVASICLNMDTSLFSSVSCVLSQLTAFSENALPIQETLAARSVDDIRRAIEEFAAQQNTQPRALTSKQRHMLMKSLVDKGLLQLRHAVPTIAETLGISRPSVYNILNNIK